MDANRWMLRTSGALCRSLAHRTPTLPAHSAPRRLADRSMNMAAQRRERRLSSMLQFKARRDHTFERPACNPFDALPGSPHCFELTITPLRSSPWFLRLTIRTNRAIDGHRGCETLADKKRNLGAPILFPPVARGIVGYRHGFAVSERQYDSPQRNVVILGQIAHNVLGPVLAQRAIHILGAIG